MNYLTLLRHGQSEWNLENRFTGFHDVDLTQKGELEAKNAGMRLRMAEIPVDQVFCSTLKRAERTAEIALQEAGIPELFGEMTAHPDLRERDYGDLTGLNKDETREKYGEEQVHIWRRSYDTPPPGGECLKDVVEKRVGPYFRKKIAPQLQDGKNLLIVAHGNSLRALLIELGVETPDTIMEAEIATGVPLVFEMDGDKPGKKHVLDDNDQDAA